MLLFTTKFLGAIRASQIAVGVHRKALGMPKKSYLPTCQQRYRECQQAPGVRLLDKEEWREHHCVVPVVDAAGAAAFVFEKPRLEGTEKEYAYHIAHGVSHT